jgi:ankyrin repeat protein
MVLSKQQFVCPKEFFEVVDGEKRYSLHLLAEQCGYGHNFESVDIVEKAILLLKRGANISYPDFDGSTVLHTIIGCVRYHQYGSKRQARSFGRIRQWVRSFHEPKEFLMASIAAGANVYAINGEGLTPSMYARLFGREKEWVEALRSTGFDPEEVVAHSDPNFHDCREPPASKLSLEKYCLRREEDLKARKSDIVNDDEEVNDDAKQNYDESYLSDTNIGRDGETDEDE